MPFVRGPDGLPVLGPDGQPLHVAPLPKGAPKGGPKGGPKPRVKANHVQDPKTCSCT